MAETIFKAATGSTGADGKPIYDVFEGSRKLELPEFQQRGLNIDLLQVGQAPTGFQSQFQPIKIEPKDNIPLAPLEKPVTKADIKAMFDEGQARIRKGYEDQIAAMAPTEGEIERRNRLTNLQEAQTRNIEDVEQRALSGATLTGGMNSEISNIQQGKTFASLPNLREQRLLTLQLGNDLAARQIEVDKAKVAIEAGNADFNMMKDYQDRIADFDEKVQERNDKLPERQKSFIDSAVTQYAGLEWKDLDPATQKSLTDLAAKFGVSVQSLQTNLKNEKNKLELDTAKKRAEIAATNRANIITKNSSANDADIYTVIRGSAGGKAPTDAFKTSFEKGVNVVAQLGDLSGAIKDEATDPIWGIIRSANPYDTKAQQIKAQLQAIVPNLARGVYGEVGVLTDQDIDNYAKTLPNIKSTKELRDVLLGITVKSVARSLETKLRVQAGAGVDVSGQEYVYKQVADTATRLLGSANASPVDNYIDENTKETNTKTTNSYWGAFSTYLFGGKK